MRKTPLKKSNPERRAARLLANFTGPYPGLDHAARVREGLCFSCKSGSTEIQAAHVMTRAGAGADWSAIIPLCPDCHRDYDEYRPWVDREAAHKEALRLARSTLIEALSMAETPEKRTEYQILFEESWISKWAAIWQG